MFKCNLNDIQMGSRTYTKLTALVKRWPLELFAHEKTLGDHLKKTVVQAYGSGGTLPAAEEAKLDRFYESCNRLVNNTHKTNYTRKYLNTSSDIEKKIPDNSRVNLDELVKTIDQDLDQRQMTQKIKNTFNFSKKSEE